MIDPDKVYHIYPVRDLQEHHLKVDYPAIGDPVCLCQCNPVWKEIENGHLVVHNSFDGRENFEYDNPVRNN